MVNIHKLILSVVIILAMPTLLYARFGVRLVQKEMIYGLPGGGGGASRNTSCSSRHMMAQYFDASGALPQGAIVQSVVAHVTVDDYCTIAGVPFGACNGPYSGSVSLGTTLSGWINVWDQTDINHYDWDKGNVWSFSGILSITYLALEYFNIDDARQIEDEKSLPDAPFQLGDDPVTSLGAFYLTETDMTFAGLLPFSITRHYHSRFMGRYPLGKGWDLNLRTRLEFPEGKGIRRIRDDNRAELYELSDDGYYRVIGSEQSGLLQLTETGWSFTDDALRSYDYDPSGTLRQIEDRNDNRLTFNYSALTNLIQNGGFEHGSYQSPTRWSPPGAPDGQGDHGGNFIVTNWQSFRGERQAAIAGAWGGHASGWCWQEVPAVPDKTYHAMAWFWADDGNPQGPWFALNSGIKIEFFSSSYTLLHYAETSLEGIHQKWECRSVQATAPPGTAWIRVAIYGDGVSAEGSLRFDEVTLHEVPIQLTSVQDPSGRQIHFQYDEDNQLESINDWTGRTVTYRYTNAPDGKLLHDVTGPSGKTVRYRYDNTGNMTTVENALGHTTVSNIYDSSSRVLIQYDAYTNRIDFAY